MKKLKTRNNKIFCNYGFMIERKDNDLFEFSDLNPQVAFKRVLSKRQRLQVGLWFMMSIFNQKESDNAE